MKKLLGLFVVLGLLAGCGRSEDAKVMAESKASDEKFKKDMKENPPCYPKCTMGDLLNPKEPQKTQGK